MVAKVGIEPTRDFSHQILSLAHLPITPLGQIWLPLSQLQVFTKNPPLALSEFTWELNPDFPPSRGGVLPLDDNLEPLYGGECGTRTHTVFLPTDFKSVATTNFTNSPIHQILKCINVSKDFHQQFLLFTLFFSF